MTEREETMIHSKPIRSKRYYAAPLDIDAVAFSTGPLMQELTKETQELLQELNKKNDGGNIEMYFVYERRTKEYVKAIFMHSGKVLLVIEKNGDLTVVPAESAKTGLDEFYIDSKRQKLLEEEYKSNSFFHELTYRCENLMEDDSKKCTHFLESCKRAGYPEEEANFLLHLYQKSDFTKLSDEKEQKLLEDFLKWGGEVFKKDLTKNVIFKAIGPGPSYAEIRRIDSSLSDPRDQRNRMLLSPVQDNAYSRALECIKVGDDTGAENILSTAFNRVIVERP